MGGGVGCVWDGVVGVGGLRRFLQSVTVSGCGMELNAHI